MESDWIQFFGNGYQGWSGFFSFSLVDVKLAIKTAVPDGIIMLVPLTKRGGEDLKNSYLILEMVNGTIGFRYDCLALYP